jgi:hypothetical protein
MEAKMLGLLSSIGFVGLLVLLSRAVRSGERAQRINSNAAAAMLSARYQ